MGKNKRRNLVRSGSPETRDLRDWRVPAVSRHAKLGVGGTEREGTELRGMTRGLTCGLGHWGTNSVPPLRLKRFAVPAFLIIATVRGFLLNFGVYSATRAALGLDFLWSPAIMFAPRVSKPYPALLRGLRLPTGPVWLT